MCKRKSNFGIFVWDCDLCNNAGIPLPRLERGREAGAEMGWHCTLHTWTVVQWTSAWMEWQCCEHWTVCIMHSAYWLSAPYIEFAFSWETQELRRDGTVCFLVNKKKQNCLFLILRFVVKDWSSCDGLTAPFVYCTWRRGSFDWFSINPCIICFTSQKICAWEQEGHAVLGGGVTGQILPGHPRRRIEVAHKFSLLCCFLISMKKYIYFTGPPNTKDWSRPLFCVLLLQCATFPFSKFSYTHELGLDFHIMWCEDSNIEKKSWRHELCGWVDDIALQD